MPFSTASIPLILYIISTVSQLFMFCWFGNEVTHKVIILFRLIVNSINSFAE